MDSTAVLRQLYKLAHDVAEGTVDGTSAEQLHWQPNGDAHPVAANYVHALLTEDRILAAARAQPPLYVAAWKDKHGIAPILERGADMAEWSRTVRVDLAKTREYARAVYATTDEYLAGASEADLDQIVDTPFGKQPRAMLLVLGAVHTANHTGENAAIKGIQGLKGYPF